MLRHLSITIFFIITMTIIHAQQVMPIYKDSIPNSRFTPDEETTTHDVIPITSKVSRPTLTVYLPSKQTATGTAVIICPGGAYAILAAKHEGTDVAKEFQKQGIAAFVLKYRIPDDATMPDKEIGPLQDAQQAIKTVRERAGEWNLNPKQIGIMGFSAGGHLASTAGTHYAKALIANPNNTSLRPDFMILIYPVISFQGSLAHMGSRENLIGKNAPAEKVDLYSGEKQVTGSTPPTFLLHATDDDVVKVENSIVFYEALLQHKVPAELHIYQSGGHGFGMNLPNRKDKWMETCLNWMTVNGWLKSSGVRVPLK